MPLNEETNDIGIILESCMRITFTIDSCVNAKLVNETIYLFWCLVCVAA